LTARLNERLGRNTTYAERESILLDFEGAVEAYLEPLWRKAAGTVLSSTGDFANEQLYFSVFRSLNDLAVKAGDIDAGLIVAWFAVVLVYGYAAYTNHRNTIYSHSRLVVVSVIVVGLATLSSIGLSAWADLPATSLTNSIVPFIAMGIGIDDAFVVLATFTDAFDVNMAPDRIAAKTMAVAGPMILYTTVTNIVVYGVASTLPVLIIQLFCWQMLINIALNFLVLFLVIIPLLRWEAKRMMAGRPETCIGTPDENGPTELWFTTLLVTFYRDYLLTTPGYVISGVLFSALFGMLAWQAFTLTTTGLDLSVISPDGSFQKEFFLQDERYIGSSDGYFVLQSDRFESREIQLLVVNAIAALQVSPWVIPIANSEVPFQTMYELQGLSFPVEPSRFYSELAVFLRDFGTTSLDRLRCKNVVTDELVDCLDMIKTTTDLPYNPNVRIHGIRMPFPLTGLNSTKKIIDSVEDVEQVVNRAIQDYDASNDASFRCYVR